MHLAEANLVGVGGGGAIREICYVGGRGVGASGAGKRQSKEKNCEAQSCKTHGFDSDKVGGASRFTFAHVKRFSRG